jgi:4-hydroxybenzoate-CoA ligase
MTFPMAVGATTILFNGRPTPESMPDPGPTKPDDLLRGADALRRDGAPCLRRRRPDRALRRCISAGEALPEEIGKRLGEALGGRDPRRRRLDRDAAHLPVERPGDVVYGTSGRAVPGYELRLVDDDGSEVADGEVGELLVRGASAADGYWNQRATKPGTTFEGHWTRTGDKYDDHPDGPVCLLRAHRRHVQGLGHLGVALRGGTGADLASGGAGGGGGGARATRRGWKSPALSC